MLTCEQRWTGSEGPARQRAGGAASGGRKTVQVPLQSDLLLQEQQGQCLQ